MILFPFVTGAILQTPLLSQDISGLSHKFLHLTDIHIDKYYVESGSFESQCHERDYKQEAGKFGSPESNCDSPVDLIKLTFQFVSDYHRMNNLDFVVWTGDNARHDNDFRLPRVENEVFEANKLATKMMLKVFGKKVPIVPTLGNNDVHPHNSLPFQERNPVLKEFSKIWKDFIPNSQIHNFLKHGSFAVDVLPKKIRVLSVNTLYLSNSNRFVTDCARRSPKHPTSAGDVVLKWIEKELIRAKNDNLNVYIIGHHPPNIRNYGAHCTERMNYLAIEFRDTIKAQFYGHMNVDHFFFPTSKKQADFEQMAPHWIKKYFQSLLKHFKTVGRSKKHVGSPVFVTSSLTPVFNPGVRVYEYSTDLNHNAEITDYHQYYLNLVDWNSRRKRHKKSPPLWEVEYSAKKEYHMNKTDFLDTKAWLGLASNIANGQKGSREAFKKNLLARTNERF